MNPDSGDCSLKNLRNELKSASNRDYAEVAARFFKTGKGEYGEGDVFIGVRVPRIREIVKGYRALSLDDACELLASPIHEERMSGAMILVQRYRARSISSDERHAIYEFYMSHAESFNNWDLVDLTAPMIAGDYLYDHDRKILFTFAKSSNLWRRRISIISTQGFIRKGDCSTTFEIAEILLGDTHDLIHKAVGWMLREAGKVNTDDEEAFLRKHLSVMPRTMLRYAIEKFPELKRKKYLEGKI